MTTTNPSQATISYDFIKLGIDADAKWHWVRRQKLSTHLSNSQHASKHRRVHIPPRITLSPRTILAGCRRSKAGRARSHSDVMGAGEDVAHALGDFGVGHAAGYGVGYLLGCRCFDNLASLKGVGIGGGVRTHHANDTGTMAQCTFGRQGAKRTAPEADGYVNHSNGWGRLAQFPPVGGYAAQKVRVEAGHHVGAALFSQLDGEFATLLKIAAVFDEVHAERLPSRVLLHRMVQRDDESAGHTEGARGPVDALSAGAPRGADEYSRERNVVFGSNQFP